jgi:circadian clock protein KaiC
LLLAGPVGRGAAAGSAPVDISYLADLIIVLRYFESGGELRKAICVVKKRSGDHERAIRELILGPDGLRLGPQLADHPGVLSGVTTDRRRPDAPPGTGHERAGG